MAASSQRHPAATALPVFNADLLSPKDNWFEDLHHHTAVDIVPISAELTPLGW